MKRLLCTICLLLLFMSVSSCSTRDMVNDRRIEKLHAEVVELYKQIAELQLTIQSQEEEIKRLKGVTMNFITPKKGSWEEMTSRAACTRSHRKTWAKICAAALHAQIRLEALEMKRIIASMWQKEKE